MSSNENGDNRKSKNTINNIQNKSAQGESSTRKRVRTSRTNNDSSPATIDLLTKLQSLQIKNGFPNQDNRSFLRPINSQNGTTSLRKGITIAGNNLKKVQIRAPEKSSMNKKDPGTPKHNFPSFEETMSEYNRNLSGTPESSHSPRTKIPSKEFRRSDLPATSKSPKSPRTRTSPKQDNRKRDLPATSKSPNSPRTQAFPKQDYRRRNLSGTPGSSHSPRTKTSSKEFRRSDLPATSKSPNSPRTQAFPSKEFRRSDLPATSKSPKSPRTRTSPKVMPQAIPTVQVKQKSIRSAFETLNNSNFDNVKMQIILSKICSDNQLPKCVNVIFLKSMDNPKQIPLYVRMCKEISKSLQKMDQFQLHLTNKCKSEVVQFREQARPNDIQNRKMLTHKALPLGTIIGELYKVELLTWSTIMALMQSLVDSNWISEGSVGLICNLHNSLGKSYNRDGGNNFILSGIDLLNEKCVAKSFSKSTCAKVQKMKELHHGLQNNIMENTLIKPIKIEQPISNDIRVSCIDIRPIIATINIDNFEETLNQLKKFRRLSEDQIGENVKMIFIEGIANLSTASVCAKLLRSFYPEKSHVVKKEIQQLINEKLKYIRTDLLVLQDSKHGENSTIEQRVYNLSMFIAELYKVDLVAHSVVFNHLQRLNDAHFRNEISVKLCCILLCYIGGKLEKDVSRKVITAYIKRLGENIEQFDSVLSDSIREVKELQLSNWQNTKPTVNKMEYAEAAELFSVTKQQQNPPLAVEKETETSNHNVTNVIRNFMASAKSSKELMSNIKALIRPENINEVTIECFCEFIKIAASENIQHLNVQDLYECFEKLQSILNLYKCNVISLCPRTSLLIEDVLNLRDHF